MFGLREAKQAMQALPEDWRKRAVEMAAGRAQLNVRRQLWTVFTFTAGVIVAGLLLAWLYKSFGLPIVVVQVGLVIVVVIAGVWIVATVLKQTFHLQAEAAKELQQSLGSDSENRAEDGTASGVRLGSDHGKHRYSRRLGGLMGSLWRVRLIFRGLLLPLRDRNHRVASCHGRIAIFCQVTAIT